MRFLVQKDYERLITVDDLNQVFDNGSDTQYTIQQRIVDSEPVAQEEISGYLRQRYDVSKVFTDTPVWDGFVTYYGDNRVQYHAPNYNAASTYIATAQVNYKGSIYISNAGNFPEPFTSTHWTFVCLDYQLFYALLPQPRYVYGQIYNAGQQVWFNNGIYTCRFTGATTDPSDTNNWTFNSTYSFTGVLPTDGTKWILGDNRNPLLVQKMVDVVLFHAYSTINPRNIPQLRIDRYAAKRDYKDDSNSTSAISWLISVAEGRLSTDLPEIPPSGIELSFRAGNGYDGTGIIQTPNMSY